MPQRTKEDIYIEESALFLESLGLPRMAGRILAWLLICDPPEQTMPDLTHRLQASKSSISTMTRMLAQFGMIERISLAGERKDFYRISPDFWSRSLETAQRKFDGFRQMSQTGLALIDAAGGEGDHGDDRGKIDENRAGNRPDRRRRLEEMFAVYDFLAEAFPQLIDEWHMRRHHAKSLQRAASGNDAATGSV